MSVVEPGAVVAPSTGGPGATGAEQLHRRALGVPDLVFFILAASAPLTAVVGGQAATYPVTGNKGIPFLFIPLAIILGVFAVGYAATGIYGVFGVATAALERPVVGPAEDSSSTATSSRMCRSWTSTWASGKAANQLP